MQYFVKNWSWRKIKSEWRISGFFGKNWTKKGQDLKCQSNWEISSNFCGLVRKTWTLQLFEVVSKHVLFWNDKWLWIIPAPTHFFSKTTNCLWFKCLFIQSRLNWFEMIQVLEFSKYGSLFDMIDYFQLIFLTVRWKDLNSIVYSSAMCMVIY